MNKQRATTLGCISGFVILCGVGLGMVTYFIQQTVIDGTREQYDDAVWQNFEKTPAPVWLLGLVFIIPGMLGVIAALLQVKCLYVTSCIFSLIALIIMGFMFFFIGMALVIFIFAMSAAKENCVDDMDRCKCRSSTYDDYTETAFKTCDILTTMTGLCIGLFVIIVIAWVFLLAAFVISCVYACRSQTDSSGSVFVPAQQPMLPPDQQYPPQYQK